MTPTVRDLIGDIDGLLVAYADATDSRRDALTAVHPLHRDSADNLIHAGVLLHRDTTTLDRNLALWGVAAVGQDSPNHRASAMAIRNALGALDDGFQPYFHTEISAALSDSATRRDTHRTALLGTARHLLVDPPIPSTPPPADTRIVRTCPTTAPADLLWARGELPRAGHIARGPRVGRARVLRRPSGEVLAPSRIWLIAREDATPPPAPACDGPVLTLTVEAQWLSTLADGDNIALVDARGLRRFFDVVSAGQGVLAEGQRNAYIAEGTFLECHFLKTRAGGLDPLDQALHLAVGDTVTFAADPDYVCDPTVTPRRIACTRPEVLASLTVGDEVHCGDGAVRGTVVATSAGVRVRITHAPPAGYDLHAGELLSFPGADLPAPELSPDTAASLAAATVPVILPRVRSVAELQALRETLPALTTRPVIIHPAPGLPAAQLVDLLLLALTWEHVGVLAEPVPTLVTLSAAAHLPLIACGETWDVR